MERITSCTPLTPKRQTSANSVGGSILCDHLCISFKSTHQLYGIIVTCLRRYISSLSHYSKHLVADPRLLIWTNRSILSGDHWQRWRRLRSRWRWWWRLVPFFFLLRIQWNNLFVEPKEQRAEKARHMHVKQRIWKINHSHTCTNTLAQTQRTHIERNPNRHRKMISVYIVQRKRRPRCDCHDYYHYDDDDWCYHWYYWANHTLFSVMVWTKMCLVHVLK